MLITIVVLLLALWAVNNYQNEKKINEEYAEIFDRSMAASYLLLINYADILYEKATIFENNARRANSITNTKNEFQEIYTNLNRRYFESQTIHRYEYWDRQYNLFISSIPYGRLCNGSELREQESKAFYKIENSRQILSRWYELTPNEFIQMCQEIKVKLNEAKRDLEKYRNFNKGINEWKNIGPEDSYELHQKYNARKNWPFNL